MDIQTASVFGGIFAMNILVQIGNLGSSLIYRLIYPIAQTATVHKVLLVCRYPGPEIQKLEYHCPPGFIRKFALAAIIYELLVLFYLSISESPACILGYRIFPHGLMSFVVAKLTGRPVIISVISGPYELYAIGTKTGIKYTKPPSGFGRIFLKMLKNAQAVITTGSVTDNFLVKHGVEESKIYPITRISPSDASRFYPVEIPKTYDVVLVARLSPEKRIEVLLHAALRVKERGRDIKVCIVGTGPCRSKLEKLAVKLKLENNVDFVGYQQDVAHYYNSAKIFVLTSEREGNPTVFLEAMMCGIPSVVSNCGDITDIARDGSNCLIVQKYDDHDGYARAVTDLLDDKDLYDKLSKNGLKTTASLPMEEAVRAWQSLFDRVVIDK